MSRFKFIPLALCAAAMVYGQLPDAPGRDTVKRVCGACHPAEMVLSKGMTREQWGGVVSNMISRGAKASDAEFAQIVDYLSTNLPPKSPATAASPAAASKRKKARPATSLIDQAGAADKQVVDEESAAAGAKIYKAQCVSCHGEQARGGAKGPDLVRSTVVLGDRYGSKLGPFLKKGHPDANSESAHLTDDQIEDLSNFLKQQVDNTLRTGPYNKVMNVLTGNPQAGEAFFNGAGHCTQCHSVTGDLAHIGSKYDPPALQLKTVFPQNVAFGRHSTSGGRKPVTVTVTLPSGQKAEGELIEMDDFNVALRDKDGEYRSFPRGPGVTVEKHDPYEGHEKLLDQYSDQNIHDVVAYLETLK